MGAKYQRLYHFLYNKWDFDELYDRAIVKPLYALRNVPLDRGRCSHHRRHRERRGARDRLALSQRLRTVQTGLVSNYALAIALGMVVIVGVYLVGFSSLHVPIFG